MNDPSANPFFVALLCILRCVVPLAILFWISYLLHKMGLVAIEAPEPPNDRDENGGKGTETTPQIETVSAEIKTLEADTDETKTVENNKESQQ
ncbi:MAG: hypothetical protein Q7T89_09785 [Anaerolineales bacterium]|nr:hypothetical protein [Anaerolineales bacterium]